MILSVVGAFGSTVGVITIWAFFHVRRRIGHISSGEQRRALCPPAVGVGDGACDSMQASDVSIQREVYTMPNGEKRFCQIVRPTKQEPTYILVFFHGYTSHSDLYLEAMCEIARKGAIVLMPDLPNHGRSDGLLCYMPDWWAWMDQIWEFMDMIVPPLRQASGKAPLRVFVSGLSLGGGLVACLAVQRPTFFDGMILVAPMLFVSDDVKPPWIVQQVFKKLLGPLKLSWPCTPIKDLGEFDFRVPAQGHAYTTANPFSMQGLKPRLASANEMGFTFPDWMEANLSQVRLPFLVLHGSADRITDPKMSQRLVDEALATDKEIKLYDGAFHCELLCCVPGNAKTINTTWLPEQRQQTLTCLKDMSEWLAARV